MAQNGGSDRQFSTLTMLIYDFGWHLRDLGRASATAWLLFLLIVADRPGQLPGLAPTPTPWEVGR